MTWAWGSVADLDLVAVVTRLECLCCGKYGLRFGGLRQHVKMSQLSLSRLGIEGKAYLV